MGSAVPGHLLTAVPQVGSVVFRLHMEVRSGTGSVASLCAQTEPPVRPWSVQGLGSAPVWGPPVMPTRPVTCLEDTELNVELALLFYGVCFMA